MPSLAHWAELRSGVVSVDHFSRTYWLASSEISVLNGLSCKGSLMSEFRHSAKNISRITLKFLQFWGLQPLPPTSSFFLFFSFSSACLGFGPLSNYKARTTLADRQSDQVTIVRTAPLQHRPPETPPTIVGSPHDKGKSLHPRQLFDTR